MRFSNNKDTSNRLYGKLLLIMLFALVGTIAIFIALQMGIARTEALDAPEKRVFDENELIAEDIASDRNIGIEEARKRTHWQEKSSVLAERLEEVLPATDYGGIWINKTTDRINVGNVEGSASSATTKNTIMRESRAAGVSDGVDIVTVKYPYSVLMKNAKAISDLQKEYIDVKNEWALQVGPAVEKNKIQIDTPKDESHMSDGHREFLSIINKQYGDQIIYSTYSEPPVPQACNWWFCDSPLRGGVGIKGNYTNSPMDCTAGVMLKNKNSGYKFLLTAGHCLGAGTSWSSKTSSHSNRLIGTMFNTLLDNQTPIDAMIIRTSGTQFSSVAGTVLKRSGEEWATLPGYKDTPPSYDEYYDMATHSTSVVGQRICISPAITGGNIAEPNGGSCGEVEQTSTSITYHTGETILVHRAGYCSRGGDSGSPIFGGSNNVKGIHVAAENPGTICSHTKYYVPISTILIGFANENIDLEVF